MTKPTRYPVLQGSPDFPALEDEVLASWKANASFEKSIAQRPAKKAGKNNEFIFYDGPPFANGLPHYGHLLTGYVKDVFARYQTMQGKRVERRFGWDCHGLPAEMGAEKELGISGRIAIAEYGIDKFNAHCQSSVMKYAGEWKEYVTRQARWVDFDGGYKTMDKDFMESVLWAFKQLYDKGLVYQSYRVMPYSWACETPLSNFETRLDNSYRERADKAVTVAFTLNEAPKGAPAADEYKLLAWTTTPWTLPSNLALGVNEKLEYVCVVKDGVCYILASSAVSSYEKELNVTSPYLRSKPGDKGYEEELEEALSKTGYKYTNVFFKGSDLVNLTYRPLFPYFAHTKNAFRILSDDFIEEGSGTGIVHLAPGFGEDDQRVCEANGIQIVCPVDSAGKFTEEVPEYKGRLVLDTNDDIIKYLKAQGSWLKTEQILHNYPHCWRTDTPLIYKAVPSWYVEVTKFKDRMVELNQQINWIPAHVKDGLFGKWLENARDWSISRNRFWGTPIPVWVSDNPKNKKPYVFGSIQELETFFKVKVEDLHRPFIDKLTAPDPEDPNYTLRRVEDVFDCWFESGSMPYAQAHYPFENKDWFEHHFPADFIVEYTAQTRGWFYTLMVLATALFDKPPFLNCICHGVVLDEKGQKLSKRLNNYADPKEIFAHYGADSLRWLMLSSPVMRGGELLIDKECTMVRDAVRLAIKPIWNAYHFFTLYANSDNIEAKYHETSDHLLDRYILAKCKQAVGQIRTSLDSYDTPAATEGVEAFFEVLNNWYIRRSRDRFWKAEYDGDKKAAYNTLYTVLHILCRAAAPLLPLTLEVIYRGLTNEESVHLTDFPDVSKILDDADLVHTMDRIRDACNAALSIRGAENLRVRLPLASVTIVAKEAFLLESYADLIRDEINVKEVLLKDNIEEFADFNLKINFPVLGKRLPEKMKQIIPAAKKGEWKKLSDGRIEIIGEVLEPEECSLQLVPKVVKGAQALSTNDALVILDIVVTPALQSEGLARDLVRLVQQARKEADLNVSDRILLHVDTANDDIKAALLSFKNYIAEQTLAVEVSAASAAACVHRSEQDLEGKKVVIGFDVAA